MEIGGKHGKFTIGKKNSRKFDENYQFAGNHQFEIGSLEEYIMSTHAARREELFSVGTTRDTLQQLLC